VWAKISGPGGVEANREEVSWVGGAFWWEVGFGMGGREGDGFVFFWEGGYLLYAFLLHITICTMFRCFFFLFFLFLCFGFGCERRRERRRGERRGRRASGSLIPFRLRMSSRLFLLGLCLNSKMYFK